MCNGNPGPDYYYGRGYRGQYKDSKKHENGTFTWSDGRGYRGQYKYNKKHGQGTYNSADGDVYRGQWKDDNMHSNNSYVRIRCFFSGLKHFFCV